MRSKSLFGVRGHAQGSDDLARGLVERAGIPRETVPLPRAPGESSSASGAETTKQAPFPG